MLSRKNQIGSICLLMLFLVSGSLMQGCSRASGYDSPENLIPVTGTVTLDEKPLANATLNFVPQSGTTGLGGYAITDASGNFTAMHFSKQAGLEPGTYQVSFSKIAMPDGSPIPPDKDAADVGAMESMPPHLSQPSPETNQYVVTVTSVPETVSFELTKKAKRLRR